MPVSNAQMPVYVVAGNTKERNLIVKEQAWMDNSLVSIPNYGLRAANGLGDAQAVSQGVSIGASTAGAAMTVPSVQAALGISAAAAGFATLGIGAAAAGVIMWLNRRGPKQKVATTEIVNEAEPILAQNRDMFLAGPQTDEAKEYALAVFNQVWASVVASCSSPSLGNPGKACVSDRQRGGKWDWFSYYYDPIANTPTKAATQVAVDGVYENVGGALAPVLGVNWDVLLGGGLLLVGVVSMFGSGRKG